MEKLYYQTKWDVVDVFVKYNGDLSRETSTHSWSECDFYFLHIQNILTGTNPGSNDWRNDGSDCGIVFQTTNYDPLENPMKAIDMNKIRQISSLAEGIVSVYLSLENIQYTFLFSNDLIVKHLLGTIESRVPCFNWHPTTNMANRVYHLINKNFQ